MRAALENPGLVSLAAGCVDLAADRPAACRALQYGTTIGDRPLRERLIERLELDDARPPGAYGDLVARTVITVGSAQLIHLVCEAILDPGDIVLVESPTYFVFLGPVQGRGARAIGVPIDSGGLVLEALEETLSDLERSGQLERVKLIYTIPEHANPSGISLARQRRAGLIEIARRWSRQHRILILEDAAYRGLSFGEDEPPTILSHDDEGKWVIHARTFSKTLSPGLKLGYGVVPADLLEPIANLKANQDFGTSNFTQAVIDRILANGDYDRHVRALQSIYAGKRDRFLEALEEHVRPLDAGIEWTRPDGGLFVWMSLPEGIDTGFDGRLFARAVESGVLYVPGEFAYADEPGPRPRHHLRLTFGLPTEAELVEGARRFGLALASCLGSQTVAVAHP